MPLVRLLARRPSATPIPSRTFARNGTSRGTARRNDSPIRHSNPTLVLLPRILFQLLDAQDIA
jgi:hypothetical protein